MNFRRVVTALGGLTLFAGLASAQLPTNQNLTCTVSAATSPAVRTEGKAELVGDVQVTCTGGPSQTGTVSDLGFVDVVVDYGVPVTSRKDGAALANGSQPIEALLFVDEPGVLGNPNPGAPVVCSSSGGACPAAVFAAGPPEGLAAGSSDAYEGVIPKDKPNQVKFANVPVVTLGGTTFQHIFRISNVRVSPGSSPVVAAVTVKATDASHIGLLLSGGSSATVASPAQGLVTSVMAPGISLCTSTDLLGSKGSPNLALLTFKEGFDGAFKWLSLTANPANQTKVGGSYKKADNQTGADTTTLQSESGVVIGAFGVANSATRVKAVFTGLDKNVTYYVSLGNVADYKTSANTIRAKLLDQAAAAGSAMETQAVPAGYAAAFATQAWGNVPVAKLTVSNKGVAEAVWEIPNPDVTAVDSLTFAVYAEYNNVSAPPTASTSTTIQLGFAPSVTDTAADAANTWIPRFSAPPAAVPFAPVLPCQTTLLFPFVTNLSGYETGIAISNTSADTFGTSNSNGKCALNFFGTYSGTGTAPTNPVWMTDSSDLATAVDLQAGKTVANTASLLLGTNVGFQGYMMAVCNFQYAHGFAYILNSTNAAMGYLASVVADTNRGTALLGEQLGN